jgi:hypothetical protein
MTLRSKELFLFKAKHLCADKQFSICVTSDFRREVDDVCAYVEYYAV